MFRWGFILLLVIGNSLSVMSQDDCGQLSSRLTINQVARVTVGNANNMRDQPTTSGARVGQIPAEGEFTVLAGPVCAEGYTWWEVEYHGLQGYTVESIGDNYALEPLDVAPQPTATIDLPPTTRQTADHAIWSVDGSKLAISGDEGIWLYDPLDWDKAPRLIAPSQWETLTEAAYTSDFSITDPRFALSHDGTRLATGYCLDRRYRNCNEGTLDVWDTDTGDRLRRYGGASDSIAGISFTDDSTVLVFGSSDTVVRFWNTRTNSVTRIIEVGNEVYRTQISPDGTRLGVVFLAGFGPGFTVYYTDEGGEPLEGAGYYGANYDLSVVFSPDVTWAVWDTYGQLLGKVQVMELTPENGYGESFGTVHDIPPLDPIAVARSFSFTHDSKRLAIGFDNGHIRLWDIVTNSELLHIENAFDDVITSIAYHPEGGYVVAISNHQVRIWDAETGDLLKEL